MSLLFEFKVFDPDLVHIFMHEKLLTNETTFPERDVGQATEADDGLADERDVGLY